MRFWLCAVLAIWFVSPAAAQLAAFSIDLGSQFTKIGLVKPGFPLDIVLNRESQRKTATAVAFKGEERLFSDQALTQTLKKPDTAFVHLVDLLGKKYDNEVVHLHRQRFPFFKMQPDDNRGSVAFKSDGDHVYTVETLLAMIIREAQRVTEKFAGHKVTDCIITVPPYFNQVERRAVINAASIAGVNLLQLMNDNTAAGVNYGMFRRKLFNETVTTMLLYDMGATKTTATVLQYQLVKDKHTLSKDPQMTVIGVGYDRTLGGLALTLCVRDELVKQFKAKTQTSVPIEESPRALGKLQKEAERVKQVLSSNTETYAQVENVMEDKDFRHHFTRDEFESLCGHLIERSAQPVNDALKMAELNPDQIDTIVLMGGGTRTPLVQSNLQTAMNGKELGKFINTDEAAALGAVYQAASLTKGFKVKKFIVKEMNLFPIQVDFNRESEEENADPARVIHRTLFNVANPYPMKKVMTFNKHTHDFEFCVNYGHLKYLNQQQIKEFGELNVTRCELGGLDAALKDNTYEGSEYKGVKVHFKMDDSGVLKADSAEAVFEKSPELVEQEESAFSAFGKKLSGLFGGGGDKKDAEKPDKDDDDSEAKEEDKEEELKHKEEKKSNEKKEKKSNEKKEKAEKKKEEKEESKEKEEKKTKKDEKEKAEESSNDKKEGEKDSTNKDDKKSDGDNKNDTTADKATNETAKNETAKEEEKPKVPKSLKVPLTLDVWFMDMPNITDDEFGESLKKLKHFDDLEKAKRDREEAQNAIESFVFETSDKLEHDEYRQLVSDEEYEAIKKVLTETNTWLEDEAGFDTSTQEFKDRLKEAKTITKDLFYRHDQAKDRPKAEEAMKQMLNYSRVFLSGMKNLTEEQQIFTDVEIETLEKLVNKTEDWWTEKSKAQTELKSHEKPAYTITEAAEKINALDREVKYLINKAKITPRKTKEKASNTTKTDDGTSANNSTTTSDEDDSSLDAAPESDDAVPPISDETVEQNETLEDDTIAAADDNDAVDSNDNASSSNDNDNDDNNSEQEVAGEDDDDYKSAKDAHEDL